MVLPIEVDRLPFNLITSASLAAASPSVGASFRPSLPPSAKSRSVDALRGGVADSCSTGADTMTGGAQEGSLRAGTQNVPYIVAFATALTIAQSDRDNKNRRLEDMRDLLISSVLEEVPTATLTGHPLQRLPGHASFTMGAGLEADALLLGLDIEGIAASSGSACTSGRNEPSTPSTVRTSDGCPISITASPSIRH